MRFSVSSSTSVAVRGVVACVVALCALGFVSAQDQAPDGQGAGGSGAAATAADESQTPVFRAGSTLVTVDVYPRRDGQIVEGLTAEDFEVLEDGELQAVEAFDFVRFDPPLPGEVPPHPRSRVEGNRLAGDPRSRVFVVFLDIFHMTRAGALSVRDPLYETLSAAIGPSDLVAVVTPETPIREITFRRSVGDALAELSGFFTSGLALENDGRPFPRNGAERDVVACTGDLDAIRGYRRDLLFTSLANLVVHLSTLRESRSHVIFVTGGWSGTGRGASRGPLDTMAGAGKAGEGRFALTAGQLPLPSGGDVITAGESYACRQMVQRLRNIDYQTRFRDLLLDAAQSNVAFYPVDLDGLTTGRASGGGLLQSASSLRTLAYETDGIPVVGTNDIAGGIARVVESVGGYYLLGYQPSDETANGRFRRIEVRVRETGVSVAARPGYWADSTELRAAAEALRPPTGPAPAVLAALEPLARIRPDDPLLVRAYRSSQGLEAVAEIATRELDRGRWPDGLSVETSATGPDGVAVVAAGHIDPGARSGAVLIPLPATATGPWQVSVRAAGTGGAGAAVQDVVDVPEAAPDGLAGGPRYFRRGTTARSVPTPAADLRFSRFERLTVEWPLAQGSEAVGARLLNSRAEAIEWPIELSEEGRADESVATVTLGIAPLAPGDYLLELDTTAGDATTRHLAAFRVVQ